MFLYNTKTKSVQKFAPLKPPTVTLYACGPTVYDFSHIGHMRTFTNIDILKRVLTQHDYSVNHVMNITDVGHLTGDSDIGEDKMEKGAKKYGKTVYEVAKFYTEFFLQSIEKLNISLPNSLCRATDHVTDMIQLISTLEKNGFTYQTDEAVYFDISKYKNYGKLSGQKLEDKTEQAREEVYKDPQKKHPADFALWFKCVGRFKNHTMHWGSPWGEGFPGWHIECSAMSMKYLGETIDIHAGGVDHIPVHHENEIAQSEAATGKEFVRFWIHFSHVLVDNVKMSKSLNNFYTIPEIEKKGFNPLALRYLFLTSHYRTTLNFTFDSLTGAQIALNKLFDTVKNLQNEKKQPLLKTVFDEHIAKFGAMCGNDLQIPQAVAFMYDLLKSDIQTSTKLELLYRFDEVFGLGFISLTKDVIPTIIFDQAQKRQEAKEKKDFGTADKLRKIIEEKGYRIKDNSTGFTIQKI